MTQYATVLLSDTVTTFIQAAEADLMASKLNALLQSDLGTEVISLTLAGAGDGHTFVTEVVTSGNPITTGPFSTFDGEDALIGCYLAASEETLAVARAATVTFMQAQPPPNPGDLLVLTDEQVAGSSKGTRFMGLIVGVWTPQG
jgi:hypothetical protein